MSSEISEAAVLHQIHLRLETLAAMSFAQLSMLPSQNSEDVRFGAATVQFNTYRSAPDDGSIEVVVQAFPPESSRHVWRKVQARGFRAYSSGEVRSLTTEELYYYT